MDFLDRHMDADPALMPALSYHAAREEQDDILRKSAKLAELDQEQPFQQTRTRFYVANLERIAGLAMPMGIR